MPPPPLAFALSSQQEVHVIYLKLPQEVYIIYLKLDENIDDKLYREFGISIIGQ